MGVHVLVVDDSEVNRVVAEAKLVEEGFDVSLAIDGREALALFSEALEKKSAPPFDVVLLDVMMPEVDGLEVLRRLRECWSPIRLPVIMATAKDRQEDVVIALEAGANDYVTKPIDLPILMARMQTHLKLKKSDDELKRAQQLLLSAAKIESVGLLAAGVAHEIRNPLGKIELAAGGMASLLDSLPEEDRPAAKLICETIHDSVEAADSIVRDLMRASEDQQLDATPRDLNGEIRIAMQHLGTEVRKHDVELVLELDESIPLVPLAVDEFHQVVEEIVENSFLAMRDMEGEKRVLTIRTRKDVLDGIGRNEGARIGMRPRDGDEVVVLEFEDTGPGMPGDSIDQVFDAFFTTRATGSGTGLGLTVVRKIVDLHKGLIRVENRKREKGGFRVSIFFRTEDGIQTSV